MKLKVMSYNILHGFRKLPPPYELEEDRLKSAQKTVKRENPDVLGINEAGFSVPNQHGVFMDYQKLFGFKYSTLCPTGPEWGAALLSRHPILSAQPIWTQNGHGIRARILKNGIVVNLDLIHPRYDANDSEKMEYLKIILGDVSKKHIIFGDFNSLSPHDAYDRENLIKEFRKFEPKRAEVMVNNLLEKKVISEIESRGLKDALLEKGSKKPTIPTARYRFGPSDIRIDYIFHTSDIKVIGAKTIRNKLTDMASDHYPIVAEFEIK